MLPPNIAKVVDIRTSAIDERINAINDFVSAGYEVHLNFSPVIYYNNWVTDYEKLFEQINDTLNEDAKRQVKCEVIFLTHNSLLHDVNMEWHPRGEELLWKPELQETKFSQTGGRNLRYKRGLKAELVDSFVNLISKKLPYCTVRYAF